MAISSKNHGEVARIPALCQRLAPHRNDNIKQLRMMIMGIPNVGKSTLMNALVRRKIAKVGDEPAVTKSQQIHQISVRHSIVDTPGLMWPKIEHPSDGLMLAASHAVGRNAIIDEEVAVFLAGLLLDRYPELLSAGVVARLPGWQAWANQPRNARDAPPDAGNKPSCSTICARRR